MKRVTSGTAAVSEGLGLRRAALTLAGGFVLWLAAAAPASAADYYVDHDVVDVFNICTAGSPCDQISEALGYADLNDGTVDTVHVGRGPTAYGATTVPDTRVTLLGGEFNAGMDGASTIIDGGASVGVTFSSGDGERTIRGFTLQGGTGALPNNRTLSGFGATAVAVEDNTFNETSGALGFHIYLDGSPTISGNTITGTEDPATSAIGISVVSAIAPQVIDNTVSGVERAISVSGNGTAAVIADNTLTPAGDDVPPGAGVYMNTLGGEVTANLITAGAGLASNSNGIYLAGDGTGTRTLARNQIFGFPAEGVYIGAMDPVTLNGDVIAGNAAAGISNNFIATSTTATNVTLWGNDAIGSTGEISLKTGASVSLDSSIVGDDGVQQYLGGAAPGCTATFSRGPAASELCTGAFATNAPPSFNNLLQDGSGYRLTAANPALIDMGNPGAGGGIDLDGDSLILDGIANGACAPRRDIGADEVAGLSTDCSPPPASAQAITGLRAAALKKCKKKKSAKKRKKCRKRARKLPV